MDFTCLTMKIINYHHASIYPFYDTYVQFTCSLKEDADNPSVQVLNVTFSVSVAGTHNERYLRADYIKQRIYLHDQLLKKLLLLQVLPFDDNICVREPCLNFEQCSSQLKLSTADNATWPVAGDSLLFRSVDPLLTYHCHCPIGKSNF